MAGKREQAGAKTELMGNMGASFQRKMEGRRGVRPAISWYGRPLEPSQNKVMRKSWDLFKGGAGPKCPSDNNKSWK